jgi:hypothetical protein
MSTSTTVTSSETRSDPPQPSRFEKKRNTTGYLLRQSRRNPT